MGSLPKAIEIKLSEHTNDIIESAKLMQQATTLIKILSVEQCKTPIPKKEFCDKYGFNRVDLLPAICQYFYEKGLNDKE